MRVSGWVALTAMVSGLAACNAQPSSGWDSKSAKDPISGAETVSAVRQFVAEGDGAVVGDVEFSCRKTAGAGNPLNLFLTLTTYGAKSEKGELPPAPLASDAVEFRIDELGGSSIKETEQVESPYNNQFKVNFAAAYGGSPRISEKLVALLPSDGLVGQAIAIGAIGQMVAGAEQGAVTSPADGIASALKAALDNPTMAAELKEPLSRVSANYLWAFQNIVLRFRATLPSGSGNDYVITVPLAGPEVVKVAEACGWSRHPTPAKAVGAPSAAATGGPPVESEVGEQAAVADTVQAKGRTATCDIYFGGDDVYQGACLFEPSVARDGSFSVSRSDGKDIIGNTSSISLSMLGEGRGTVSLTNSSGAGRNVIDEPFERSTEDKACWVQVGVDEDAPSICVR